MGRAYLAVATGNLTIGHTPSINYRQIAYIIIGCYSTRDEITGLGGMSGITGLVDVLVAKYV